MTLPVTGPHQESYARPKPGDPYVNDVVWTRVRWRQKRPIDRPLPYLSGGAYVVRRTGTEQSSSATAEQAALVDFPPGVLADLRSKAYDKLRDKAFSSAQLSTSLLESAQSMSTLRQRMLQLAAFTLALKNGKFKTAARILAIPAPPRRVGRVKGVAGQWLEYHLGWEPLVKDIGNAVDVLQQPIKNTHVSAASSWGAPVVVKTNWPPGPWSTGTYRVYEKLQVKYGMDVAIDNPNLFLANNLGFVNPAKVAWELVPFSFVLDWFVNVGQFLSLGTDFLGLSVENAYSTAHCSGTWIRRWGDPPAGESEFTWWKTQRELGITTPPLHLKKMKLPSWQRGLTAASLLTGLLHSIR